MFETLYLIGQRPYMEDFYYLDEFFCDGKYSLYAIFDGHGGNTVSLKCRELLPNILELNLAKLSTEQDALKKTFLDLDDSMDLSDSFMTGSTCLVILKKQDTLWIANCGDSRSIIQYEKSYHLLSLDHKPEETERTRIEALGGNIVFSGGTLRVNGDLALTRAIGDKRHRPFIIPDPEIKKYKLTSKNKFIVLATDGLWDVVSNKNVIELIMKHYDNKKHSDKKVLENAMNDLKERIENVIYDNTTVVLIHIRR
jgi:serine/threonine protein phosphatase PrpC